MAGGASGIRAGKAYVEVGADTKPLEQKLADVRRALGEWGSSVLNKIGAALSGSGTSMLASVSSAATSFSGDWTSMLASVVSAATSFAEAGSRISDMSDRTGIGAESLSALGYAAQQSGADLDTLELGVRKMQNSITDAANGNKAANATFERLGVSMEDLMSQSPDEQFRLIADAVSRVEDPTERAALAMDVFGKSGTALLPMISGGAKGLRAFEDQARALGIVMSAEDAKAADALGDAMDGLKAATGGLTNAIGAALAPALTDLAMKAAAMVAQMTRWVRENQAALDSVIGIAEGLVKWGIAAAAAAAAMKIAAAAMALYEARAKGAAMWQTVLTALSGPKGWAQVAAGVLAAVAALYALDAAMEGVNGQVAAAERAMDAARQGALDAAIPVDEVGAAFGRAGDGAERLRKLLKDAATPAEALAEKLRDIDRRKRENADAGNAAIAEQSRLLVKAAGADTEKQFNAMLDQAARLEEQIQAAALADAAFDRLREKAINSATDIKDKLRDVNEEIERLSGGATKSAQALRRMAEAGLPKDLLDQYAAALEKRDRLKKQEKEEQEKKKEAKRTAEEAERERKSAFKKQQTEAEAVRERTRTPLEKFEEERRRLKKLRDAHDPATGKSLIDDETYQRGLALASKKLREEMGKQQIGVVGTFNASAARGFGAANPLLDVNKQQLEYLKKIAAKPGPAVT